MTVERQAAVALKWNSAAKLASQVFSWVVTWILLRLLAPDDYGLMAVCVVFVSILAGIAEFGLGSAVIQARRLRRADLEALTGALGLFNLAAGALLVLCAPWIADFLGDVRLEAVAQILSLQLFFFAIEAVPQALLQRHMRFKTIAVIELSATLATSITTLVLALYDFGVWALVIGTLVGSATRTMLTVTLGPFVLPSLNLRGMSRHVRFGGIMTLTRFLWQLTYQLDTLIAARFLGQQAVGLYSVATYVANLPMTKAMGIVNQVAFPAVARLQADLARMRIALLDSIRLLAFVAIPSLWGLSAVSLEFVDAVLGEKWHAAVFPLQVISLVAPMRMLMAVLATAVAAVGRAEVELRNTVVGVVLLPLSYFIGVQGGLQGLSLAWLIAIPLLVLFNFPRTSRALGLSLAPLVRSVRGPLIGGALMYLAVAGMRQLLPEYDDWVRLPLLVATGAITYVAAVRLLDRSIWVDARRFIAAARS